MKWILGSDIDGTLTGDPAALASLVQRTDAARAQGALHLILVTGRSYGQVLSGLADEGLPQPDAIIAQVGTEIYLPPFTPDAVPFAEWHDFLAASYAVADVDAMVADIPGAVDQGAIHNTTLKRSWWFDGCADPEAAAATVMQRVQEADGDYRVIWSSGRDLDILPAESGKGKALRFLIEHLGLTDHAVLVAGDTGNDIDLFAEFDHGVAVANALPELRVFVEASSKPGVKMATQRHAAGVLEGLYGCGVLNAD